MKSVTESTVEQAALAWLESYGWRTAHGPSIASGTPSAACGRRANPWDQLWLESRTWEWGSSASS